MLRPLVIGLSHKTAPLDLRERFNFQDESMDSRLNELNGREHIEECLILSTCNRIEVYAVSDDLDSARKSIEGFLSAHSGQPVSDFSRHLYVSYGNAAVRHIYSVACGMDSMVVGEPQILGQVKQAYRNAKASGTAGLILNRLCHSAFFVAKKVRSETGIGSRAVSVSYVAVELARRIFDDLSKRSVMLIGSGDMAELAARSLVNSGVGELLIASRNFERSRLLSDSLKGNTIRYEELFYHLKEVDIVITATGSPDFIIRQSHVREALKLRNNEPMFMIDIAVPRDIDPRVEELSDIYLYDIDDLKNVLDENVKSRRAHAMEAERIVSDAEKTFEAWLESLKAVPAIIDLKNRLHMIKEAEVARAVSKLEGRTEKDREVVEQMASRIVDKILHGPLTNLKKEASTSLGALYVDSVKALFELENILLPVEDEDYEGTVKDRNQGE